MGRDSAANEKLSDNIGDGKITPQGGRLYVGLHGLEKSSSLPLCERREAASSSQLKQGGSAD